MLVIAWTTAQILRRIDFGGGASMRSAGGPPGGIPPRRKR
jgi:hypothetical protein